MQHNNKHTDKKLQELENQSLPDLSKMDTHWQQMKTVLQPAVKPARPKSGSVKKLFRWTIAAALIGGSFLMVYYFANKPGNGKTTIAKTGQYPVSSKSSKDTTPSITLITTKTTTKRDTVLFTPVKQVPVQKKLILTPSKKTDPPAPVIIFTAPSPAKKDTLKISLPEDNSAMLANFFKQLEKQPEEFVINTRRDTIIRGAKGTEVFIPAYTFANDKKVTIQLQEFYSYDDMIAHRLNTVSGEEQLITGGMLNIRAFQDNKEVTYIQKNIMVSMPAEKYDREMQLFLPASYNTIRLNTSMDTMPTGNPPSRGIFSWASAGQSQGLNDRMPSIKVLDLTNDYADYNSQTGTAKFLISKNSPLSNEEIKKEMKRRYGYKKVKVRRVASDVQHRLFSWTTLKNVVGDSTYVPFDYAVRLKLISREDSIRFMDDLKKARYKDSVTYMTLSKLESRYSFRLNTLGWINCDRFYNDRRPKINYSITLNDPANNFHTMLVFEDINSIMQGTINGNKVVFQNVPVGETAKVISVGVQDGKIVAAMEKITISRTPLTNLKFEETDASAFKEQTRDLSKL